jgi:hypothetical protein
MKACTCYELSKRSGKFRQFLVAKGIDKFQIDIEVLIDEPLPPGNKKKAQKEIYAEQKSVGQAR